MFNKFKKATTLFRQTKQSLASGIIDDKAYAEMRAAFNRVRRLNGIFGLFRLTGIHVGISVRERLQMEYDVSVLQAQQCFTIAQKKAASGEDNKKEIERARVLIKTSQELKKSFIFPLIRDRKKSSPSNGDTLNGIDQVELTIYACVGALNAVQIAIQRVQECLSRTAPSVEGASDELAKAEKSIERYHKERYLNGCSDGEETRVADALQSQNLGPDDLKRIQAEFEKATSDCLARVVDKEIGMLRVASCRPDFHDWQKESWTNDIIKLIAKANGTLRSFNIPPPLWKELTGKERDPDKPFNVEGIKTFSLLQAPSPK